MKNLELIENQNKLIDILLPNGGIIKTEFHQIIVWPDGMFCLGRKLGSEYLSLITTEGEILENEIIKRFSNGYFAAHEHIQYVESFKDYDRHHDYHCSYILDYNLNRLFGIKENAEFGDYVDGHLLINSSIIIDELGKRVYSGPKRVVKVVWDNLRKSTFSAEDKVIKSASEAVFNIWVKDFKTYLFLNKIVQSFLNHSNNLEEFYLILKYCRRYCDTSKVENLFEDESIFFHFDLNVILNYLTQKFTIEDKIDYWDRYNESLNPNKMYNEIFELFDLSYLVCEERKVGIQKFIDQIILSFNNTFSSEVWSITLEKFNKKYKIENQRGYNKISKIGYENRSDLNIEEYIEFLSL